MERLIPLCLFVLLFICKSCTGTIAAREEGIGEMFDPVREVVDGWTDGGWVDE